MWIQKIINIQQEIYSLEKQIIQLDKRINRHHFILSVPQVLEEREKIEKMYENDKKRLLDLKQKLLAVKWLFE